MKKSCKIVLAICVLAMELVGCGSKDTSSTVSHDRYTTSLSTIQSVAGIRQLFALGMGTNEITSKFGEPSSVMELNKKEVMWHYALQAFPADDEMKGSYVVGVGLTITNGCLGYLGCVYVDKPRQKATQTETVLPIGERDGNPPNLKFFVVSDEPIPGGRFIDTGRFPKLGFIPQTPSLTVQKLKSLFLEEQKLSNPGEPERTVWAFSVLLAKDDVTHLKDMTTTNVLKTVLLMVGDEPVIAARMMSPIESGNLLIECDDRPMMEKVREQLSKMKQQSQ